MTVIPIIGLEDEASEHTEQGMAWGSKEEQYWRPHMANSPYYQNYVKNLYGYNKRIIKREWNSLWNYLDTAINLTSELKESERASRSPGDTEWAGGSWSDAVRRAYGGWPEGVHMARTFADQVRYEIEDEYQLVFSPSVQHDLTGQMVDVGRFLAGEPEAMMDILVEEKSKPVVKLLINSSASFRIKPEAVIRRGAIAVALVDLLEDMGMRCEVIMVVPIASENWTGINGLQYYVTVKKPDHTLQIDSLIFMIANPAALRRIAFSVMETEPKEVRDAMDISRWGGYGFPTQPLPYPYDIYVPALTASNAEFNTDDGAKAWMLDVLREQGLEFLKGQEEL